MIVLMSYIFEVKLQVATDGIGPVFITMNLVNTRLPLPPVR